MSFATNNDVQIHYEIHGSGDPVVLIPGLGSSAASWGAVAPQLVEDHTVMIVEPRGSGRSDAPDVPYTSEVVADDLAAALDAAGWERAHIVGVSMGGMIGQEMALRRPDRVTSLVLVSTYAKGDAWSERVFAMRRRVIEQCGLHDQFRLSTLFLTSPVTFRDHLPLVQAYEAGVLSAPPDERAFLRQMTFCVDHDTEQRLREIDVPTMVVAGTRDLLIPPHLSRDLADGIRGAEYQELDGSHALVAECAGELTELVLKFLSGASLREC